MVVDKWDTQLVLAIWVDIISYKADINIGTMNLWR